MSTYDRSVVDDIGTLLLLQVRDSSFTAEEVGMHVDLESVEPLLRVESEDIFILKLLSRAAPDEQSQVQTRNIEATELNGMWTYLLKRMLSLPNLATVSSTHLMQFSSTLRS